MVPKLKRPTRVYLQKVKPKVCLHHHMITAKRTVLLQPFTISGVDKCFLLKDALVIEEAGNFHPHFFHGEQSLVGEAQAVERWNFKLFIL